MCYNLPVAYANVVFENQHTGSIKNAPIGFSWTVFFFSFFPPLFRRDIVWSIIILICAVCTYGISNLIFCFIYNKIYIKKLIGIGYKANHQGSANIDFISGKLGLKIPANTTEPKQSNVSGNISIHINTTTSEKNKK